VHESGCARSMSNEQRDVAVVGKFAYGIEQGVATRVVEEASDNRVELITELEQLEGLPGAGCAGTQHRVDHDALLPRLPGRVSSVCAWRSTSRRQESKRRKLMQPTGLRRLVLMVWTICLREPCLSHDYKRRRW
jgi:hypothetical protein